MQENLFCPSHGKSAFYQTYGGEKRCAACGEIMKINMSEVRTVSLNCPVCRNVTHYNSDKPSAHCMSCGNIVHGAKKPPPNTNPGGPTVTARTEPIQIVSANNETREKASEHPLPRWLLLATTIVLARNFFLDDTPLGTLVIAACVWLFSTFVIVSGAVGDGRRISGVSSFALIVSVSLLTLGWISARSGGVPFTDCVDVGRYSEVECH